MESERDMLADLLGPVAPAKSIPAEMNESELAMLLGITANQVRTKARDGIIIRLAPNRYDVRASLSNYLTRLRDHAGRAGRPTEGGDELKREKIRQAKQAADKLELQNAAARDELVPVADVKREWVSVATDLRGAILAIPARVSGRMNLSREAAVLLEDEIRKALEGLTDGQ